MIKLFNGIILCAACDAASGQENYAAIHIISSMFAVKAKQNVFHIRLNHVRYRRKIMIYTASAHTEYDHLHILFGVKNQI